MWFFFSVALKSVCASGKLLVVLLQSKRTFKSQELFWFFLHTLTTLSDFALHPFFPTSELTEDQTSPPLINMECLTATSGHVRRQLEKLSSSKSICDSESYLQPESEAGDDTIEMENILSDSSTGEVDKVQTYWLQIACEEGDGETRQSTSDQRWNILTLCSLHTVHHLHAAQLLIILHDSATDTDREGNISKHTHHLMDCWQTGVAPPNLTSVACAVAIPVPLVHLRLSVQLRLTPPSEILFDSGVVGCIRDGQEEDYKAPVDDFGNEWAEETTHRGEQSHHTGNLSYHMLSCSIIQYICLPDVIIIIIIITQYLFCMHFTNMG